EFAQPLEHVIGHGDAAFAGAWGASISGSRYAVDPDAITGAATQLVVWVWVIERKCAGAIQLGQLVTVAVSGNPVNADRGTIIPSDALVRSLTADGGVEVADQARQAIIVGKQIQPVVVEVGNDRMLVLRSQLENSGGHAAIVASSAAVMIPAATNLVDHGQSNALQFFMQGRIDTVAGARHHQLPVNILC